MVHERDMGGGLTEAQSRLPRFPDRSPPDGPSIRDLVTGAVPIQAPLGTFAAAFGATFALQQLALWLLGRGWQRPWLAILFDLVRLPSNLTATLSLLGRRTLGFQVTPKGRTGAHPRRAPAPPVLSAVAVVSIAAAVWFVATIAGRTPLRGEPSTLVLEAPGRDVALRCAVRARCDHPDGSQTVAVEFQPGQWPAVGTLTHLLFNAGVGLEVVPGPVSVAAVA